MCWCGGSIGVLHVGWAGQPEIAEKPIPTLPLCHPNPSLSTGTEPASQCTKPATVTKSAASGCNAEDVRPPGSEPRGASSGPLPDDPLCARGPQAPEGDALPDDPFGDLAAVRLKTEFLPDPVTGDEGGPEVLPGPPASDGDPLCSSRDIAVPPASDGDPFCSPRDIAVPPASDGDPLCSPPDIAVPPASDGDPLCSPRDNGLINLSFLDHELDPAYGRLPSSSFRGAPSFRAASSFRADSSFREAPSFRGLSGSARGLSSRGGFAPYSFPGSTPSFRMLSAMNSEPSFVRVFSDCIPGGSFRVVGDLDDDSQRSSGASSPQSSPRPRRATIVAPEPASQLSRDLVSQGSTLLDYARQGSSLLSTTPSTLLTRTLAAMKAAMKLTQRMEERRDAGSMRSANSTFSRPLEGENMERTNGSNRSGGTNGEVFGVIWRIGNCARNDRCRAGLCLVGARAAGDPCPGEGISVRSSPTCQSAQ